MSFVIVAFLGLWAYGFNTITTTLQGIDSDNEFYNFSDAVDKTFVQVNNAEQTWLPQLALVLIFGLMMTIFVSNFVVKTHPAFFVVYLMVIIGAVIGSVYISNAYEDLMMNEIVGGTFQGWTAVSFVMVQLPIFTTVLGVLGAVFLFSGVGRDAGMGGGI